MKTIIVSISIALVIGCSEKPLSNSKVVESSNVIAETVEENDSLQGEFISSYSVEKKLIKTDQNIYYSVDSVILEEPIQCLETGKMMYFYSTVFPRYYIALLDVLKPVIWEVGINNSIIKVDNIETDFHIMMLDTFTSFGYKNQIDYNLSLSKLEAPKLVIDIAPPVLVDW
jgi:hypothetical protein